MDIPRSSRYQTIMDYNMFDWRLFLMATGLALIFEGLPYFIFADKMPQVLAALASRPPELLRKLGLVALLGGLLLIYVSRP